MKKIFFLILSLLLVILLAIPAWGATTVTYPAPGVIYLDPGASPTDYDSTVKFPDGFRITGIVAYFDVGTTVLKFRNGSASGGFLPFLNVVAGGTGVFYWPKASKGNLYKPYLKAADQNWGTPASVGIWIFYE